MSQAKVILLMTHNHLETQMHASIHAYSALVELQADLTLEVNAVLHKRVQQLRVLGQDDERPPALCQGLQHISILVEDGAFHLVVLHRFQEL